MIKSGLTRSNMVSKRPKMRNIVHLIAWLCLAQLGFCARVCDDQKWYHGWLSDLYDVRYQAMHYSGNGDFVVVGGTTTSLAELGNA